MQWTVTNCDRSLWRLGESFILVPPSGLPVFTTVDYNGDIMAKNQESRGPEISSLSASYYKWWAPTQRHSFLPKLCSMHLRGFCVCVSLTCFLTGLKREKRRGKHKTRGFYQRFSHWFRPIRLQFDCFIFLCRSARNQDIDLLRQLTTQLWSI